MTTCNATHAAKHARIASAVAGIRRPLTVRERYTLLAVRTLTPGATTGTVADVLGTATVQEQSYPVVSDTLGALVALGLLEASDAGCVAHYRLTDKGEEALRRAEEQWRRSDGVRRVLRGGDA